MALAQGHRLIDRLQGDLELQDDEPAGGDPGLSPTHILRTEQGVGPLDDEDGVARLLIDEDRRHPAGGLGGQDMGGIDAVAPVVLDSALGEEVIADPGEHEHP